MGFSEAKAPLINSKGRRKEELFVTSLPLLQLFKPTYLLTSQRGSIYRDRLTEPSAASRLLQEYNPKPLPAQLLCEKHPKAQEKGKHFTWWCEQQWKKGGMPCGCQNQVHASILCSLNRQQAGNDRILLYFCLLVKKLKFQQKPTKFSIDGKTPQIMVPQSLQTLDLQWHLLLPNHMASEIEMQEQNQPGNPPSEKHTPTEHSHQKRLKFSTKGLLPLPAGCHHCHT